MPLDDQFQVAVIIDKLPPLWKDFKSTLRHKTKEFSLEIITHLRIEEARRHDQKEEVNAISKKQFTVVLKLDLKSKGNKMKRARNCRNENHPITQANLVEKELVAMIIEINVIGNTGASHHVCHDLSLFRKYNETKDKNILLGDHHKTKVASIGEVELKFTSGKLLVLKEVLHTLEIQKNLECNAGHVSTFGDGVKGKVVGKGNINRSGAPALIEVRLVEG
ncbi:putative Polyprotein [Cucumis melo var. makuwa]|uniref:Polyprotein n=1 Tax=Cucumis melo var. makuwa TaxID=1194695 RepID=A0A5A7VI78_CUCMM|nr:putative Polyprotein [Cucumis melo var. makuwa]TYK08717.1 putative Polyprotein [Cucumis melo var. makuwa]